MNKIKRALISVYDKRGLVEFAKILKRYQIEMISTGGTAKFLKENQIPVIEVSDYTGFPELLEGRVKTLHPKIHAALLALRNREDHFADLKEFGIIPVDLVVVNLYPFESIISLRDSTLEQALEHIDIGGPAMIRSASKNFTHVTTVTDPEDYSWIGRILDENKGTIPESINRELAAKAFSLTSRYDWVISQYLSPKEATGLADLLTFHGRKVTDLRYGENPHQIAALYTLSEDLPGGLQDFIQHGGKELSYNNLLDIDSACRLVWDFETPTVTIVKHTNPCGVGTAETIDAAAYLALEGDPVSAFGGIVACNREVSGPLAQFLSETFFEVIAAPSFTSDALKILKKKKNLRLIQIKNPSLWQQAESLLDVRKLVAGVLVQKKNESYVRPEWKVVTVKQPTEEQWKALRFAWKVARFVKSNALVISDATKTIGIGAGQMSRVDATKIALMKAKRDISGLVVASDAFFPFRDSVDLLASHKISAIIQPGGSMRDPEVIDSCNEHGIAMVLTGQRYFRH